MKIFVFYLTDNTTNDHNEVITSDKVTTKHYTIQEVTHPVDGGVSNDK